MSVKSVHEWFKIVCAGQVWELVWVNLRLCGRCTASVKLERFLLEGWLSWWLSKVKRWCYVTYLDEWSPPSGMSTSAIPSFLLSFFLNLLFGVTTESPSFDVLKSLTDVSSWDILICFAAENDNPACHVRCKINSK